MLTTTRKTPAMSNNSLAIGHVLIVRLKKKMSVLWRKAFKSDPVTKFNSGQTPDEIIDKYATDNGQILPRHGILTKWD